MSDKNIITQSEVGQVKVSESLIAENLLAHANASLSKAHGIEFMLLPSPFYDAGGNDVSFYADSGGDRVGSHQMRLTFNNTNYYVPLESTLLAGQDPLTGVKTTPQVVQGDGGTAWVTDFAAGAVESLNAVNSSLLLPHTQLAHWQTHSGNVYAVLPQIVLDSAGHRVSNYVARLVYKGSAMLVPCDPRLGGPVQLARPHAFSPNHYRFSSSGPNDNLENSPFTVTFDGTKPATIQWQAASAADDWFDLTASDGSTYFNLINWNPGIKYIWPGAGVAGQETIRITYMRPVVNTWRVLYLRALITNAAGTAASEPIQIDIKDKTGSWIVYAAHEVSPFSNAEMLRLYHIRLRSLKAHPEETNVYMRATGYQLVERMKAKGFDFATLTTEIRGFLCDGLDYETRFRMFKAMVLREFAAHWPDCPDPVIRRLQNDLHAVDQH